MQKSEELAKIGVIGGGSWATALVKIMSENSVRIQWWFRQKEDVKYIREYGKNPRYLSDIQINTRKVKPTSELLRCVEESDILLFAVPAAFVKDLLLSLPSDALKDKIIISAIKGMIPGENILITDFIQQHFGTPASQLCIIAGPCHSEEIAQEKRSYLTIAGNELSTAQHVAKLLSCRYVKSTPMTDLSGAEYCAIMKNIIAIACGAARGLNFGDNFQAVLVSNAMQEIARFLARHSPATRDLHASAYLGDLLVTCYSPYSRNRNLGYLVGRGYSVKAAQTEMNMVAEGYYAVKCVYELNQQLGIEMPITRAVYNILYEKISPIVEMRLLENSMH